jgi:hypothetical protein
LKWSFTDGFAPRSLLSAVASDDRGYVAVGLDGQGATAWTSMDGSTWQKANSSALAGTPLRITSLTAWNGGFVAGGFRGSEFFSADAMFWVSPDGRSWQRADDSPDLLGARVSGVTAGGPGLVAVGQTGPADAPGPAIVWTSVDGVSWTRVPDNTAFHDGRMRGIADIPGVGLVAVGEDIAGDTGIIWLSKDGRTWTRAPADPTFGRTGIQVRIYTVTAGPAGVVAAGTLNEGIQYGAAAVWTSPDGMTWKREPSAVAFLDTEMTASTRWNDRVVEVGDRGAPDAYQATTWLSPPGVGH